MNIFEISEIIAPFRTPTSHIDIRILHSGSTAQHNGDSGNHDLWDPNVYVVLRVLLICVDFVVGTMYVACTESES